MNKKITFITIVVLLLVIGLVYFFTNQPKEQNTTTSSLTTEKIFNTSLNIQDGPDKSTIQLINGHYDFEYADFKAWSKIEEKDKTLFSLDVSPKIEYGDINNDGLIDAIAMYIRGSGGNKPSYGVAVFLNDSGVPKNIFSREFTWLDSITIEKSGRIKVDFRTIYNGAAGYSGGETAYFVFKDNTLIREQAEGYKLFDFASATKNKQGWKSYRNVVPDFEFKYPNYFDDPFVTREAELNKGDQLITLVFAANVHDSRYGRLGVSVQKEFSLNKKLPDSGKILQTQKYDKNRGECYDEISDGRKVYGGNLIIGGKHVCVVSDKRNLKEYAIPSGDGKYMVMVNVITNEPAAGETNEFTPNVSEMIEGIISSIKFN